MSLDLADMRTLFKGAGQAAFAVATGKGETRVEDVTRELAEFPLNEEGQLGGAKSLLVGLSGGPDLGLREMESIATGVARLVGGEPRTAVGSHIDESMQGEIRAMVLAAGLSSSELVTPEFQLHAQEQGMRGIPLYRSSLKSARGHEPASGERELSPSRADNMEIPAYLRKGKNGPTPLLRN